MFKIYLITYVLNASNENISRLCDEIKKYDTYWHYSHSIWFIQTLDSANTINNKLSRFLDRNDTILVIETGEDKQGWLTKEAWNWLNNRG